MTDTITLFVYGSLRPGLPLWPWLEHTAEAVRDEATTHGALWMVKGGSYPWLTKGGEKNVVGTLVTVPVDETFARLVNVEIGAGYELGFAPCWHEGQVVNALLFRYPHVYEGFVRVPGQDWSTWTKRVEDYDPRDWERLA